MAERKRTAETTKKRLTRGPRKGQVVEVYVKSGTEVRRKTGVKGENHTRVFGGQATNRQKGNPLRRRQR